jgi:hypothetical protein
LLLVIGKEWSVIALSELLPLLLLLPFLSIHNLLSVIMVIADRATVRKKSGNRSITILPDADIDEAIDGSDTIVMTALNKFDWDALTDPGYKAVKEVSELFATADILSRFQDQQDNSKEEFDRAEKYLAILKENYSGATDDEDLTNIVNIVSASRQTFPLNPSASYRRPNGRLTDLASEGIEDHRRLF